MGRNEYLAKCFHCPRHRKFEFFKFKEKVRHLPVEIEFLKCFRKNLFRKLQSKQRIFRFGKNFQATNLKKNQIVLSNREIGGRGGLGTCVDKSQNFLPLVEVFLSQNGYFSKYLRYFYQEHPKNHFLYIYQQISPGNSEIGKNVPGFYTGFGPEATENVLNNAF